MLEKISLLSSTVFYFLRYKILYGSRIRMEMINSIRGKFRVEIKAGGCCVIGGGLMSRGPLYIKILEESRLIIGDKCFFNHNCSITCADEIRIGNGCMFANNCVIVDHDHLITESGVSERLKTASIVIDDNVWIGANVTITKGVHIGKGAVVGANAVVTDDVEEGTVVAGIPAKRIR